MSTITNYEQAAAYFDGARDKTAGRPLASNTRLVRCVVWVDDERVETLGIRLHSTIVVAYLPDGRAVLNSGGWHTQTTSKRIAEYSPARVGTAQHYDDDGRRTDRSWAVSTSAAIGYTPERVQKCRTCKGTGQTESFSYGEYRMREGAEHVDPMDHVAWWNAREWVRYDTPRGTSHECYRCKGTGRTDYGSQPRLAPFIDGAIVDASGAVVGQTRSTGVPVPLYGERTRLYRPEPTYAPRVEYTSPDAMTLRLSEMTAEAEAEMEAWNAIIRGAKGRAS